MFICDECVELCMDIIPRGEQDVDGEVARGCTPPQDIIKILDEYVIGQKQAKKILSVAVSTTTTSASRPPPEWRCRACEVEHHAVGPTGCGKTYLAQTLARIIDVPFTMADATTLTEAVMSARDVEKSS